MPLTEDILLGLDEAVVVAVTKGVTEIRVPVDVVHELVVAARETLDYHAFMDEAIPATKCLIGLASCVVAWAEPFAGIDAPASAPEEG